MTPGADGVTEDDLLQLDRQVCFPLYAASNLITRLYRPLLDELGLTYTQYLVMMVLWERAPRTVGQVGQQLHLETSTLTPLLKRMEIARWLVRQRDPTDERRVLVTLTPKGERLREKARRVPEALAANLSIPVADLESLRASVSNLVDNLTSALEPT
jgi:DNA-binding MarR family transcriptional regulator